MSDWLVLDEALKPEWEKVASEKASEILSRKTGKKVAAVVRLELPTLEEARRAWKGNRDLRGKIGLRIGKESERTWSIALPYRGVFIHRSQSRGQAQALTWNTWLANRRRDPKKKTPLAKELMADLKDREVISFPRWLVDMLGRRLTQGEEPNLASLVSIEILAGSLQGKEGAFPCLIHVDSDNLIELSARLSSVRRARLTRFSVDRIGIENRQNIDSFEGRICPFETPESEHVGLALQLARGARVAADGSICPAGEEVADRLSWGCGLLPFMHCSDGARSTMGAKNLRQAVPVIGREVPSVKTGGERALAERMADFAAIGLCADSLDAHGDLALGRDLLVAYLPWFGWNVDDAIVISRSAAEKMGVVEHRWFSREFGAEWTCAAEQTKGADRELKCGETLAKLTDRRGRSYEIRYQDRDPARLTELAIVEPSAQTGFAGRLKFRLEKDVALGLGDKLMGRHGNKGVVGLVEKDEKMPRLPDDPRLPEALRGRPVDILLNPHGVLSRKNPAQLLETHAGWLLHAGCKEADLKAVGKKELPLACPECGVIDHAKVRKLFVKTGLDDLGRIPLELPASRGGGTTESPVVVGFQHFVRLHHIPGQKSQARRGGQACSYSEADGQAVRGRKTGGGQRLGEMEIWSLAAQGVPTLLEEMLGGKADRAWAEEWPLDGAPPKGKIYSGFGGLLKDWLFALGIEPKLEGDAMKFVRLDRKTLQKRIRTSHEVENGLGFEEVRTATCCCKKCGWHPEGEFPLEGSSVRLGGFLAGCGYESDGRLEKTSDGGYVLKVLKPGEGEGLLLFSFSGTTGKEAWLKATVTCDGQNPPKDWPAYAQELTLFFEASYREEEKPLLPAEWSSKNLQGSVLLKLFLSDDSTRSVLQMSLTCPKGHASMKLEAKPPYGCTYSPISGGLFDPKVFGSGSGWGMISLPQEVTVTIGKGKDVKELTVDIVPVLPVRYRNPRRKSERFAAPHDLNALYVGILEAKRGWKAEDEASGKALVQAVQNYFRELERRLNDKHGVIRRNGLGRRIDRSARLVITPDPTLDWNQAGLSAEILWELAGDQASGILNKGAKDRDRRTESVGWDYLRSDEPKAGFRKTMGDFLKRPIVDALGGTMNRVVVLNRQPTLHRDGMQAFHPVMTSGAVRDVLRISPLCCLGFAADFDGDQMVAHYPLSDAAQLDGQKLLPDNHLHSVASGLPTVNYDRDFVSGTELLRKTETWRKIVGDGDWCDGAEAGSPAPGEFGRAVVHHLCSCKDSCKDKVRKISELARAAFAACTRAGLSISFYDLLDRKEDGRRDAVALITETGANGRKQLPTDIALAKGQAWEALFANSRTARASLCEKKLNSAKSGGLTRQLVLALWPLTIVEEDCGVKNHGLCNCRSEGGFCAACYGAPDGTRPDGTMVEVGAPVGLDAAQSIGERGTQLTMQAIHGVAGGAGFSLSDARKLFLQPSGKEYFDTNRSAAENMENFVRAATGFEAYAQIDRRHFEILWRVLNDAPGHKLSDLVNASDGGAEGDTARRIASRNQLQNILQAAEAGQAVCAKSPFARVMFNLFGSRARGAEE